MAANQTGIMFEKWGQVMGVPREGQEIYSIQVEGEEGWREIRENRAFDEARALELKPLDNVVVQIKSVKGVTSVVGVVSRASGPAARAA